MIPLIIHGVGGRMGRRVADLAARDPEFEIRAGLERRGHPLIGQTPGGCPVVDSFDRAACLAGTGSPGPAVVIDFSSPEALKSLAGLCAGRGLALVSGTTGLTPEVNRLLDEAASRVPVVWAPNMSPGVNLLYRLVDVAAQALPGADVEIVEHHHRHKTDAPSGTARRLAEVVIRARRGGAVKTGRSGDTSGRPAGEIGIHAVRMGEVVGDHHVHLSLDQEILTLSHHARSRDAFASGALTAARFAAAAPPGRYGMEDVLGLGATISLNPGGGA